MTIPFLYRKRLSLKIHYQTLILDLFIKIFSKLYFKSLEYHIYTLLVGIHVCVETQIIRTRISPLLFGIEAAIISAAAMRLLHLLLCLGIRDQTALAFVFYTAFFTCGDKYPQYVKSVTQYVSCASADDNAG